MARIICVGAVVHDQVYWVPEIPSRAVKVLATRHRTSGGGMAATAAVAIAALGGESIFWGRVGDDATGATLCRWLSDAGVDAGSVRRVRGAQTATSAVLTDPRGERLLAAFPGPDLGADASWLPLETIDTADAVLCDVRWMDGAASALAAARRYRVPTILDAELAPRESLDRLIGLSDHVVFSERALLDYSGLADRRTALLAIAGRSDARFGVTIGDEGAEFVQVGRIERTPAYPVSVRETNGAGDVFHGAYALAVAEGRSMADAATFANAAASIKCALGGGWTAMPDYKSIKDLIESGNATHRG